MQACEGRVIVLLGMKEKSQVASVSLHLLVHSAHCMHHMLIIIIIEPGQRTTHTHMSALLPHSLKRDRLNGEAFKVRRS